MLAVAVVAVVAWVARVAVVSVWGLETGGAGQKKKQGKARCPG